MIPQRNLSVLSNRLAASGGRRIPEAVLERDYCIAWFLAALSRSDLKPDLAFKGGTALKRCYLSDYRFSEDLDFTLLQPLSLDDIRSRLEDVFKRVRDDSGILFRFDREDRQKHTNSYTFYLSYIGPLPRESDLKVDITVREHVVFPLEQRPVLRGYEEYADVSEDRLIQVYSLQEIATEKVLALSDRARNEPRDLYDLWHMTTHQGIELENLRNAIRQKLDFRGDPREGIETAILKKQARLEALWSNRLGNQVGSLPPFEEVFRVIRRALRRAGLP